MTSLIAYSWYFWVLPSELTIANAGANIGGAFGAVTIAVVAAQMLANNYGWVDMFYVTGGILELVTHLKFCENGTTKLDFGFYYVKGFYYWYHT